MSKELKDHWENQKLPSALQRKVYYKEDVDTLIAEKDEEIARLNTVIKGAVNTMKSQDEEIVELKEKLGAVNELVKESKELLKESQKMHQRCADNASKQIRRLKRTLWLARAERANDKARIFYFAETCGVKLNIDGYSNKEKGHTRMCTARWWRITWLKVERKCRAMADKWR